MALNLKLGKAAVTFEYTDDNMTAAWAVKAEDGQDKLLTTMRKVLAFVEAQEGAPPLPERLPGFALGMAQTQHPRMVDPDVPVPYVPTEPAVGNGWASVVQQAPPELPEDRKGEWEIIPPGERG